MPANAHLILHNIVAVGSALALVGLIVFLLIQDHKKTVNITLALTAGAFVVFLISHAIGVSVTDSLLSRNILMWNLSVIWICTFNFHCAMAALHREKERKWMIRFVYALGFGLTLFYLVFPETFILTSMPKMYFPNYYVPGQFHWVMRVIFQLIIPAYFVYELARAYRHAPETVERNRILYFTLALGMGWLFGIIPDLLIYNIPVDPIYGVGSAVLFLSLFTYAVLKYELLDIRVVAKKAFVYGVAITVTGGAIALFNFSNQWIQEGYPGFPFWITPLISALIVVAIGVAVWRQLREGDILKYEFVTTVTHKFRTPLTHIKWATENLVKAETAEDRNEQIGYIQSADAKLVELTNLLANASETNDDLYQYKLEHSDFTGFVTEVVALSSEHASAKKIRIEEDIPPETYAVFDIARLRFVLQTLVENAVNYTPVGGVITVNVASTAKMVTCSVKDSGIGIAKSDLNHIFTKLYRSKEARSMDTEGMGIGLYISKNIIARHRGKLWVESGGIGKGATFSFSVPVK